MPIEIARQSDGYWYGYRCVYMGEDAKVLDLLFPEIVKAVEERNNISNKIVDV